MTILLIFIQNR